MDDILIAQFERVEKALGTLVDSIAAYNPSPQAAIDLVAADDELSQGLDQRMLPEQPPQSDQANQTVARHQGNHARIHALRAEADALEEKLKSSVEKLATLRHELSDTPATAFPETARAVSIEELLQNASYISKYTVPPTYRERVPDANDEKDKDKDDAASSAAPTNSVNTPMIASEVADPAKDTADGQREGEDAGGAGLEITAEEEEWLRKLKDSQFPWYPWPSNEKIRIGNLQKLMYHRERGDNLDEFDVKAYYESQMPTDTPVKEPTPEVQQEEVQPEIIQPRAAAPSQPQQPKKTLDIFDDMDDEM
jgi:hypothetical protein